MNRNLTIVAPLVVLSALIPLMAQTGVAHKDRKGNRKAPAPAASAEVARGQEIFDQNCSRCHNAPESIPPQITGTVLRHMRVRASLSADDERALLRFMNP